MSTCSTDCTSTAVQIAGVNPSAELPEFDDHAAAGDWGMYLRRCMFIAANPAVKAADAMVLKRRIALAYLGQRAQTRGGVFLRSRPSVFTPELIEKLAVENARSRYARYPWLEQLTQLQQQLDHDQYKADAPIGTAVKPARPRQKLQVVPNAVA